VDVVTMKGRSLLYYQQSLSYFTSSEDV